MNNLYAMTDEMRWRLETQNLPSVRLTTYRHQYLEMRKEPQENHVELKYLA